MIVIEYCKDGIPVSDFNYSDWLLTVKNTKADHIFKVSTSLPIDLVRLAIVRNELNHNNIAFKYCDDVFQANEYGAIQNWPVGFCDREISVSRDILQCAMRKRKAI